ncbi:NifU family protein [Flavobacterium urocaniciphilum]|uniref:Fe-S cluster biogenesis protein NfuA, 4Fe-4S-binding domain n=1 Tax=Flavobacterium urocaniciphilum TaxID=1299341 RepID=A0A1H9DLJ0_9FLAO|nr:NifU family protein [Flavobacterium urocaniciphilum]SEQ14372.1 Fe-S cluster biogenesis protein NfuA, 4Fe-4S-binding domain [Flavobacterium urocaniciphilum]
MGKISIKITNNSSIVKFELEENITRNNNYEFKNIDETAKSPLAKQLFFLPFVKTVYISGNFIAIEKFSIVEWEDVQDEVAQQIEEYIEKGGKIILEEETTVKKNPITIYAESTPNPSVTKFVANKMLTKTAVECKNIDETKASPLAKDLFSFPFVKEVFIDENYVSITKYDIADWNEITFELRNFLKQYLEQTDLVVDESLIEKTDNFKIKQDEYFDNLDVTSQQIINILEEYVKPAVQSDGGNITFNSYDETSNVVKVTLQGACSGCPSSTFTLKNGIENMLRQMLSNNTIIVEAMNG